MLLEHPFCFGDVDGALHVGGVLLCEGELAFDGLGVKVHGEGEEDAGDGDCDYQFDKCETISRFFASLRMTWVNATRMTLEDHFFLRYSHL